MRKNFVSVKKVDSQRNISIPNSGKKNQTLIKTQFNSNLNKNPFKKYSILQSQIPGNSNLNTISYSKSKEFVKSEKFGRINYDDLLYFKHEFALQLENSLKVHKLLDEILNEYNLETKKLFESNLLMKGKDEIISLLLKIKKLDKKIDQIYLNNNLSIPQINMKQNTQNYGDLAENDTSYRSSRLNPEDHSNDLILKTFNSSIINDYMKSNSSDLLRDQERKHKTNSYYLKKKSSGIKNSSIRLTIDRPECNQKNIFDLEKDDLMSRLSSTINSQGERLNFFESKSEISKPFTETVFKNKNVENDFGENQLTYIKVYSYFGQKWILAKNNTEHEQYVWVKIDKMTNIPNNDVVKIDELEQNYDIILSSNKSLKNQICENTEKLTDFCEKIQEKDSKIASLNSEITKLKVLIQQNEKEIETLNRNSLIQINEISKKNHCEVKELKNKIDEKSKELKKLSHEIKVYEIERNNLKNTRTKRLIDSQTMTENFLNENEEDSKKIRLLIQEKEVEILKIKEKSNKFETNLASQISRTCQLKKDNDDLKFKIIEIQKEGKLTKENYEKLQNDSEMIIENLYEENKELLEKNKKTEKELKSQLKKLSEELENLRRENLDIMNKNKNALNDGIILKSEIENFEDILKKEKITNLFEENTVGNKFPAHEFKPQMETIKFEILSTSININKEVMFELKNELQIKDRIILEKKENQIHLIEKIKLLEENINIAQKNLVLAEKKLNIKEEEIEGLNLTYKDKLDIIEKFSNENEKFSLIIRKLENEIGEKNNSINILQKELQEKEMNGNNQLELIINEKDQVLNQLKRELKETLTENTNLNEKFKTFEDIINKKTEEINNLKHTLQRNFELSQRMNEKINMLNKIIEEKDHLIRSNEEVANNVNFNEENKINEDSMLNEKVNEIKKFNTLHIVEVSKFKIDMKKTSKTLNNKSKYEEIEMLNSKIKELENKLIEKKSIHSKNIKELTSQFMELNDKYILIESSLKIEKEKSLSLSEKLRSKKYLDTQIANCVYLEIIIENPNECFNQDWRNTILTKSSFRIYNHEELINKSQRNSLFYNMRMTTIDFEYLGNTKKDVHELERNDLEYLTKSKENKLTSLYIEEMKNIQSQKESTLLDRISELELANNEMSNRYNNDQYIISELQDKIMNLESNDHDFKIKSNSKMENNSDYLNSIESNNKKTSHTAFDNKIHESKLALRNNQIEENKKSLRNLMEINSNDQRKLRKTTFLSNLYRIEVKNLNLENCRILKELNQSKNEIENLLIEKDELKSEIKILKEKFEISKSHLSDSEKIYENLLEKTGKIKRTNETSLDLKTIPELKRLVLEFEEKNIFESEINEGLREKIRNLNLINDNLNYKIENHWNELSEKNREINRELYAKINLLRDENDNLKKITDELKNKLIFFNAIINEKESLIITINEKNEKSEKNLNEKIKQLSDQIELKNFMIMELNSKSNILEIEKFDAIRKSKLIEKKSYNSNPLHQKKNIQIFEEITKKDKELKIENENLKEKLEKMNVVLKEFMKFHPEIKIDKNDTLLENSVAEICETKNDVIDFSAFEEEKSNFIDQISKLNNIIAQKDRNIKNLEKELYIHSIAKSEERPERRSLNIKFDNDEKINNFMKINRSLKIENEELRDKISNLNNQIDVKSNMVNPLKKMASKQVKGYLDESSQNSQYIN